MIARRPLCLHIDMQQAVLRVRVSSVTGVKALTHIHTIVVPCYSGHQQIEQARAGLAD